MKEPEKKRRTIPEIRDSKKTGEKMVYTSVLDYTSAKWAEAAGVDVCVVGDSLAMTAHGHPNTVPATMDMMVLHSQAVRRGAPNTFVLGCMPYQSYNSVDRALVNATRFMQDHLKFLTMRGVFREVVEHEFGESGHCGERIVQFMSNTRRHLTDSCQLGSL